MQNVPHKGGKVEEPGRRQWQSRWRMGVMDARRVGNGALASNMPHSQTTKIAKAAILKEKWEVNGEGVDARVLREGWSDCRRPPQHRSDEEVEAEEEGAQLGKVQKQGQWEEGHGKWWRGSHDVSCATEK